MTNNTPPSDAPTIADSLARASQLDNVSDSARLDCELLLCHVLTETRSYLYTWPEKQLTEKQQLSFDAYFARRQSGEPIAHILGTKEFWSLELLVNNSTLIPRPETELLIETALMLFAEDTAEKTIVDLGTGSGAIALAIASERPNWQVLGVEKYPEALALAKANLDRLALTNVRWLCSDWFSQVAACRFDMIVANPPYIDEKDPHLAFGDVRFEPRTALTAACDGLADLQQIIRQAPDYLTTGGWLLLEHGYRQADTVHQLLGAQGFSDCFSKTDLQGHERLTGARLV